MITLSSDFGDYYPAAMRGVLAARSDARLIDVSHAFPRQDIRSSAFWLRELLPYFPPAVHLVVVDPGVGTDRAAIVIRAGEHTLVGPDNGVLVPVARRLDGGSAGETTDSSRFDVFEIVSDDATVGLPWLPVSESTTFDGRDLFAPAAAFVHDRGRGVLERESTFRRLASFVDLTFPGPSVGDGSASGEVLVVDGFGTLITNIPGSVVRDRSAVTVNGEEVTIGRTYASVDPGTGLVTVGSHGHVELAVNQGRGVSRFGLEPGDSVTLEW